jgi:hypothetical protein
MSPRAFFDALAGQVPEAQSRFLDQADVLYQSFPELGLAFRLQNDHLAEIAIAQIPRVAGVANAN